MMSYERNVSETHWKCEKCGIDRGQRRDGAIYCNPCADEEIERRFREKEEKEKQGWACCLCGTKETPIRRKSEFGFRTACNACGLKYWKKLRRQNQTNQRNNKKRKSNRKKTKSKPATDEEETDDDDIRDAVLQKSVSNRNPSNNSCDDNASDGNASDGNDGDDNGDYGEGEEEEEDDGDDNQDIIDVVDDNGADDDFVPSGWNDENDVQKNNENQSDECDRQEAQRYSKSLRSRKLDKPSLGKVQKHKSHHNNALTDGISGIRRSSRLRRSETISETDDVEIQLFSDDADRDCETTRTEDLNRIRDEQRDKNRDEGRDRNRDEERDRNRDEERDRKRDEERDRKRDEERDRKRDEERDRKRDEERDGKRDEQRDRERDKQVDIARDDERHLKRDEERDQLRDKERDKKRDRLRDKERDERVDKERDEQRHLIRDIKRDKERDKLRDKQWLRERDQGRDRKRDSARDVKRDAERDLKRDAGRDLKRDRERDRYIGKLEMQQLESSNYRAYSHLLGIPQSTYRNAMKNFHFISNTDHGVIQDEQNDIENVSPFQSSTMGRNTRNRRVNPALDRYRLEMDDYSSEIAELSMSDDIHMNERGNKRRRLSERRNENTEDRNRDPIRVLSSDEVGKDGEDDDQELDLIPNFGSEAEANSRALHEEWVLDRRASLRRRLEDMQKRQSRWQSLMDNHRKSMRTHRNTSNGS